MNTNILICILVYFFVYLTMLAYTLYKLNNKVNEINKIVCQELGFLKIAIEKSKKERKERKINLVKSKKKEKNIFE